ncbi:GxxExxY protein [Clostridium beijerinckii]|uniref:GxxExxY protein n=1 Tax=Clostridium beijerinckii TaxID=1520 RepID=UPI001360EDE0|nr:GxxExxY protein [Clostridium beijerinckii]MZK50972.1 AAA family ATPase [Clostridium beijerinckii]MZK59174.1 AAA family ATPase [Clostridium beijerinckii]MZK69293.1 AAA family ATPase [Clostridium beijerinckii]MZK74666.1 AAA family ATPase [Clostridium beijerinckii]MZK84385.1 AAA family ATPase [Clostridium beijerinckii]
MNRRFNTTGVCIPHLHYMVDITNKLTQIKNMVYRGDYFVINRPRQYGKTTTMYMLEQELKDEYLVLSISFEGLGDLIFEEEKTFSKTILKIFGDSIQFNYQEYSSKLYEMSEDINDLNAVSKAITNFCRIVDKEIVLFIDEVDKSSNNQLFMSFLGMLRNKFLLRQQGKDKTFYSVILAGVYDIKNLKLKIRQDDEKKYNSPWNIAVNFNVDMSFNSDEISTMLKEYSEDKNVTISIKEISEIIYFYTSGYPFLVSRLCQIIDENQLLWNEENINRSVKELLQENNTLFDDLVKNIENNNEFKDYIFDLIINGTEKTFNIHNPLINLGVIYGYLKNIDGRVKISNRIFEQMLYNYFSSKLENNTDMSTYNFKENFIIENGLDFEKILLKFQQFIKEQYSSIDSKFIEREGRLLFLAFIKPIINGVGFDFKEVQISEEKRLDIVVSYLSSKYVIELKIWRGAEYHKKGLNQLKDYLDIQGLDKGYLVVYNFNKDKEYKKEIIHYEGKEIFVVFV